MKEHLKSVLSLFTTSEVPDNILIEYIEQTDKGNEEMQDWIGLNIKPEVEWSTAIGIMDACDLIVNEAANNGNIVL
jgi:hypothetical protein